MPLVPLGFPMPRHASKKEVALWIVVFFIISVCAVAGTAAQDADPVAAGGDGGATRADEQAVTVSWLAQQEPLSASLHILPPLEHGHWDRHVADGSLAGHLEVGVCEASGGGCIAEPVMIEGEGSLSGVMLYGNKYRLEWKPQEGDAGREFLFFFSVAGLEIGDYHYFVGSRRAYSIRFQIDDNPQIRARVMHEQGSSAEEIATQLVGEFALGPDAIAEILLAENFGYDEVARALIAGFKMDAWLAAAFLRQHGYSARQTYDVLMEVYDIDSETLVEDILSTAGYDAEEFLYFTSLGSVRKFAPVLMFDGSYRGVPMSAQEYFEKVMNFLPPVIDSELGTITWTTPWYGPGDWDPEIPFIWKCSGDGVIYVCSRDECICGMENSNFSSLTSGSVPTYYKVIKDGEGRLRIDYWWFYGFQHACSYVTGCPGNDGSHHGDWEHLQVTTDANRTQADYVTFPFHGDWYTRAAGGFSVDPETGLRPMVYVGKLGHGSYHDQTKSGWMAGTPHHCCEYADYRNPHSDTTWWNTYDNLVALAGNSEPWMLADRVGSPYEYNGAEYTITAWRWGPHISYCNFGGDWCSDWEHNYAPGTHPTIGYSTNPPLGWEAHSCSAEGCGDEYCNGLLYQAGGIYLNQGWPWDG